MILETSTSPEAQLASVPENGKAEIINGKVVRMSPTGGRPGRASLQIVRSLLAHEEQHGGGYALPDNVGFLVKLPKRGSFSPDAAWYIGPTIDMQFVRGAPAFAVEVRSEGDYGPAAERAIVAKIADYFEAGTSVVWDVDLLGAEVVRKYTAQQPTSPIVFHRGDVADAEPVVNGWRFEVDKLLS
jgi:Uma2 family endonuclease